MNLIASFPVCRDDITCGNELRQAAFRAYASLGANDEDIRKRVSEYWRHFHLHLILLPPRTKLREGDVFTPVCQSFCAPGVGGVSQHAMDHGVCVSQHAMNHGVCVSQHATSQPVRECDQGVYISPPVNKRAICNLLECFLVLYIIFGGSEGSCIFTACKRSCEGYFFHMCLSVTGTPHQAGTPPGQVPPWAGTPPGRYTPQTDTPGKYTPLAGTPPPGRYIPPATVHTVDRLIEGFRSSVFGKVFAPIFKEVKYIFSQISPTSYLSEDYSFKKVLGKQF